MYTFWQEHYPNFYDGVVEEVSDKDLADGSKYFWKNKHDLKYEQLNPRFVKAFLSRVKVKPDQNLMSYESLRKFHDALLWGAKQAGSGLPRRYYMQLYQYLKAYKRELAQGKKREIVDEKEADPNSWALLVHILTWAVECVCLGVLITTMELNGAFCQHRPTWISQLPDER